jgi:hypothetical protein
MRLSSDYTEIVVYSTRVPGYWAGQTYGGDKFFLYTLDKSYKKGDVLEFEGALGAAPAAVFDEETRIYRSDQVTNIYVVWRARLSGAGKVKEPAAKETRKE